MNLKHSSQAQAKEALEKTDLLIVPLGATEVYGPHLPMGAETIIGDYLGQQLGERVGAVVTPTVPVTCSGLLDRFPGNLYVSPAALRAYLHDICACAVCWGIKRIFFLNVHGPNMAPIEEISRELLWQGVRCAQIDCWRFMLRLAGDLLKGGEYASGHASEMATAVMLAIQPDLVQRDKFTNVVPKRTIAADYPDVMTYIPWSDVTPTGHTGDPSKATREAGEILLARTLDRLEQFLRNWQ